MSSATNRGTASPGWGTHGAAAGIKLEARSVRESPRTVVIESRHTTGAEDPEQDW